MQFTTHFGRATNGLSYILKTQVNGYLFSQPKFWPDLRDGLIDLKKSFSKETKKNGNVL